MIRMKTVVTNIIRTEEFTPTGEPIYVINSQNVVVADVPDGLKKPAQIQ
jgi:ribosomal protein L13